MFKLSLLLTAASEAILAKLPEGSDQHRFRDIVPLAVGQQMNMSSPYHGGPYGGGIPGGMGMFNPGYGMNGGYMPMMMMRPQYPSYMPSMMNNNDTVINGTRASNVDQGNYNQGLDYASNNSWDKGTSNTKSNTYNHGNYNSGSNNQGFLNSAAASQLNQMRRLEAIAEYESMHQVESDEFEDLIEGEDEETIDGQHFMKSRRNRRYSGYGGGSNGYGSRMGGGYGGYGGVHQRYNNQYMPQQNYGRSSSGYGRQNQSMNQGVQQGHYNAGDVYQNQSGWDRGYNNTNARSNRRGGSDHQYRSGMHQNQMGYYQNQYGGGMYR